MQIGIIKETVHNDTRVAISPDVAKKFVKFGYELFIETDAGNNANFSNENYRDVGVNVVSLDEVYRQSEIFIKIHAPSEDELSKIPDGSTLVSMVWPRQNEDLLKKYADKKLSVIAMDSIPRISRAQKMDVLSSMSNISGYRAVVEASSYFGRFLGGQITAAGKINPAKVLIIGAGVAGLSAIGAANNMGAIVRAFDTRGDAREQVESMDAEFLEVKIEEDGNSDNGYAKTMSKEFIEAEMALFLEQAKEVDIIITTALIPGKPAPKLITKEMVQAMRKGSVIVDLASEQGGNCELTVKGEVANEYGVSIVGFYDLPARLPEQASQLYGSNIAHLFDDLTPNKDGEINIDFDDEVIRGATVVKNGEITFPPPPIKVSRVAKREAKEEVVVKEKKKSMISSSFVALVVVSALTLYLGSVAPSEFLSHFIVFVLSCFVGYQVIWNITPALHTPLMSVTNAISGIIVLGGLVQMSSSSSLSIIVASIAIFIATINIVGGFFVTNKTLKMFQR